jgi:hypothetical protein
MIVAKNLSGIILSARSDERCARTDGLWVMRAHLYAKAARGWVRAGYLRRALGCYDWSVAEYKRCLSRFEDPRYLDGRDQKEVDDQIRTLESSQKKSMRNAYRLKAVLDGEWRGLGVEPKKLHCTKFVNWICRKLEHYI